MCWDIILKSHVCEVKLFQRISKQKQQHDHSQARGSQIENIDFKSKHCIQFQNPKLV